MLLQRLARCAVVLLLAASAHGFAPSILVADGLAPSALMLLRSAGANVVETALTAFYRATGIGKLSDFLRGNAAACGVAWCFLLVAGVAHGLTHLGALSESAAASARAAETAATALVYLVSGPSEFVDVSYELAVGNVNIHVLTTLAVAGTVFLGCALEGALLLVLFSTAAFVEMRLTGHARGDLKSLWATVPGEAVLVDVDAAGAPVAATEQVIPARDVRVGAHVFVRSGQQVRRVFVFVVFLFSMTPESDIARWRASGPTPMTILSQKPPRGG